MKGGGRMWSGCDEDAASAGEAAVGAIAVGGRPEERRNPLF